MADLGDLVEFLGPVEMATAIKLPDATWEHRFATHNSLTVPLVAGAQCFRATWPLKKGAHFT